MVSALAAAVSAPVPQVPYGDAGGAVSESDVAGALRAEQALGYNLVAAPNGSRLVAGVLLRLARAAHARDSLARPFLVTAEAYEAAFAEVTGTARTALPPAVRMATEYHEDMLVEHRRAHVLKAVIEGPTPLFVIRVQAGWSDTTTPRFSYEDQSSSPTVRVTHERENSYVIVDYGDMIVDDQIRGIGGRVTSGPLKALFTVFGEAHATQTRFAVARDGTEVARVWGRKGPVSLSETVTIRPGGAASKGVPSGRNDLRDLEKRLGRRQKLQYATVEAQSP
jgi:hypothetical protein